MRSARGFAYRQTNRGALREGSVLKRIESLAIPPGWTEVRICVLADGHIQATGRDARRRKQYLYHEEWRRIRDRQKYAHVLAFAGALPRIRRRVQRDLGSAGLTKTKALAAVVRLLDLSRIRVGNEEYARHNNSFGLTTLRNRHVRIRGERLRFQFRGKSGKNHSVELSDARLARVVACCQEIPGQELFQYFDGQGRRRKIKSADVNRYLREISGGDFTAKDFRTWAGTVLLAVELRGLRHFRSPAQARANVARAIQAVAVRMGNTPAICRKCYVHPAIIQTYLSGGNLWPARKRWPARGSTPCGGLRAEEAAVLRLLRGDSAASDCSLGQSPRTTDLAPYFL